MFQRRPNWSAPLNNGPISEAEMAQIRARYDEIFARCDATPGGFEHEPDRRGFWSVSREERLALWEPPLRRARLRHLARELPRDLHRRGRQRRVLRVHRRADPQAGARSSDRRDADPARPRLRRAASAARDPLLRGLQPGQRPSRRPLRRRRSSASPRTGSRPPEREYELDVIVYATGFDAVTGAFDRIDIHGRSGFELRAVLAPGARDVPRHDGPRLPEPVHAHRAAERIGVDQLSARHRDRRQLVHRTAAAHAEARRQHWSSRPPRRSAAGPITSRSCPRSC